MPITKNQFVPAQRHTGRAAIRTLSNIKMKTLINTLITTALTVLIIAGAPAGPALASTPIDGQISQALTGSLPDLQLPAQSADSHPRVDVAQLGSLFGDEGIPSVPEMTLERYRAIDVGSTSICGILQRNGRIVCWGLNDFGQANALQGVYTSLSMGQYHGCAIKKSGALTCWGLPTAMPQGKQGLGRYRLVSSGDDHTCALRNNNTVECWGDNSDGELDAPPGKYRNISARGNHTCGLTTAKQIKCWGESQFIAYTPASGRFIEVSTGQLHACALRLEDGKAVCWGNNSDGQTQPPVNESFIHLVSGDYHTCGLRADHSTVCWGRNQFGQTDLFIDDVRQIAAGGALSCALTRKGGHLHCVGSFAHNPFLAGQQTGPTDLSDGMAAPQFAWALFMPGLTSLFDGATSNVMDLLFDKSLNKWQQGGKGASIVFSLLGLIFGQVLPGETADPLPPEYKEMLQDIQTRVQELQASMATVNLKVGETKTAVDKLLCSDSTQTVRNAAQYVKSELKGTSKYGPANLMKQALDQYNMVMTDMNNGSPNRVKARQDMEEFYKRVVEFKKEYMVKDTNLAKTNDLVTDSLLGQEDAKGSPLDACKAVSRNTWLANKPYPFDDRPIWRGSYETLRSARTTQAAIANLLSQNAGFELVAAFSGPKFRNDGTTELDPAPPITDYKPTAIDNSQGICEKAEQETGRAGANPRWYRVQDLCEGIAEDARKRYRDYVRITEFMGGAYSDRDMVLSLTAKQMGDAQPSNTNEDNWLWLRNPSVGDFREYLKGEFYYQYSDMKPSMYSAKPDKSPFGGKFSFKDSQGKLLQSDTEVYMNNVDAEDKSSFAEGVWHSSRFAWDDLFQAREKMRKEWKLEDTYEDVVERMADEPSRIDPPCQHNLQGNCETKTKQNAQGVWVNEIVPGKLPQRLFENVKEVPYWLVHTGPNPEVSRRVDQIYQQFYSYGYKAYGGDDNYRFSNVIGGFAFIASGINKAKIENGRPSGPHWYHPSPTDESKRAYLKMSGRLVSAYEWAAAMINARGQGPGFDCRKESSCIGLGFSIFDTPSFRPYQKSQWFAGDMQKDPPRLKVFSDGSYAGLSYRQDFWERAHFTHLPVVRISQRQCRNSLIASNVEEVIGSGASPEFDSLRSNSRAVDSVTVPSICGSDLDLVIQQGMTRPANVDIPEVRVIQ